MRGYRLNRDRTVLLLRELVKGEIKSIVNKIMEKFDNEITPFEDAEDPARPSVFRSEFEQFLTSTISDNISITSTVGGSKGTLISVDIGIGDENKLGFGEKLDEETTDGLRIIGTIIQGIAGNYVLVTSDMTGEPEGRFGKAFIMPVEQYRKEAPSKGWDPNKPIWAFSNFRGIPSFFSDINMEGIVNSITNKLANALKRA